MFNKKISSIGAVAAFILSLLIGIISGGTFLIVLLRAAMCGVVFFALITGGSILIHIFLPELLFLGQDEASVPGSQVDISIEDEQDEQQLDASSLVQEKENDQDQDKDKALKEAFAAALNPKESPQDEVAGLDQRLEKEYSKEEKVMDNSVAASPEPLVRAASDTPPQTQAKGIEPWEEIAPTNKDERKQEPPVSRKKQNSSMVQSKGKNTAINNLDPKQMASTIQTMLRQN